MRSLIIGGVALLVATSAMRIEAGAGAAGAGSFLQYVCDDSSCKDSCEVSRLEQYACYPTTTAGSSAEAWCSSNGLFLKQAIYPFSTNCTQYSYEQSTMTGTCSRGAVGYVDYVCSSDSPVAAHRTGNAISRTVGSPAATMFVVQPLPDKWFGEATDAAAYAATLSKLRSVAINKETRRAHIFVNVEARPPRQLEARHVRARDALSGHAIDQQIVVGLQLLPAGGESGNPVSLVAEYQIDLDAIGSVAAGAILLTTADGAPLLSLVR